MTPIQLLDGDILEDPAEAIFVPVNTVGVMGAGLALAVKRRYPVLHTIYVSLCHSALIQVGVTWTVVLPERRFVLFPTKSDWRRPSRLAWIEAGLRHYEKELLFHKPQSIAIPALGCGKGGLEWDVVRRVVTNAFAQTDLDARLYRPRNNT